MTTCPFLPKYSAIRCALEPLPEAKMTMPFMIQLFGAKISPDLLAPGILHFKLKICLILIKFISLQASNHKIERYV
jgi:hypothetical protein